MWIDKWNPVFAPDVEAGTEAPASEAPPIPMNERPVDGPGSGRSVLRQQLEKSFETDRKAADKEAPEEKPTRRGRQRVNHVEEPEAAAAPPETTAPEGATEATEAPAAEATLAVAAPEGWSKEAKAEWANVPAAVQAAVAKREADTTKGVEELKKRYADLDQALAPRVEMLRQAGHTPAAAVNQLFAWFEALNANPRVAFPALAESFKFDLRQLLPAQPAQPAQPAAAPEAGEQPAGDVPPAVQQYITKLEEQLTGLNQAVTQRFGQLENTFAEQSYAKTNDILNTWAKDKPYFEDVRQMMAHLIGSNAIPPLANGSADLDKAYDAAIWAMEDVRVKVLADQQKKADDERKAKVEKERLAQQTQADKARRANVSVAGSAPGGPATPAKAKTGKSVKESLKEAIAELNQ